MLNKIYKNHSGFTLIEIFVVISILGILMTMVMNFILIGLKSTRFESEQAEAVQHARDGINVMKTEIRGANSSARGDYPLQTIENQEFIFFADIDKDDVYEKVRYYVSASELKKDVNEPGGANNYNTATSTSVIARYVNNLNEDIFTYYNSNRATTSVINEIRLINMNLKINVTPEIAPADIYVETDATLRNLKSNL